MSVLRRFNYRRYGSHPLFSAFKRMIVIYALLATGDQGNVGLPLRWIRSLQRRS